MSHIQTQSLQLAFKNGNEYLRSVDEVDIKSRLLNSSDTKIAAAARRVFAQSPIDVHQNKCIATLVSSRHGFILPSTDISDDIQAAASAVAMLAPQKCVTSSLPCQNQLSMTSQTSNESKSQLQLTDTPSDPKSHRSLDIPLERLNRSRERNKMHARKTRQRKKEHMDCLEKRVEELKMEQVTLKLHINEKTTANILLGLFSTTSNQDESPIDARVEVLLKRPTEEIPDVSQIPELPALILPVHSNKKRTHLALDDKNPHLTTPMQEYPDDGIDYDLLGKDRSLCTSTELDLIRKERNRMHAKRTRDRKRIFMDSMQEIIIKLEEENDLLASYLDSIGGSLTDKPTEVQSSLPCLVSPELKPSNPKIGAANILDSAIVPDHVLSSTNELSSDSISIEHRFFSERNFHPMTMFNSDSGAVSPVATSSNSSVSDDMDGINENNGNMRISTLKKQCFGIYGSVGLHATLPSPKEAMT